MGKEANELTQQIIEYCLYKKHYVFKSVNASFRKHRNNLTKGVADIMGITKNEKPLAIEVKIGADTQSEHQKEFQKNWELRGGIYLIAGSLDDVIKAGL